MGSAYRDGEEERGIVILVKQNGGWCHVLAVEKC